MAWDDTLGTYRTGVRHSLRKEFQVTHRQDIENLIRVKTALADKYTRLALVRKSKPWKTRYLRRAEDYRRQASSLTRQAGH
jgi:hypothetical protein